MNKTNLTNSSTFTNKTQTPVPIDYLFQTLNIIDHTSRYYCLFVHIVFFIILSFSKYFQKRTMLYVNHATIVNCFYCISQIFYIFGDHPTLPDQNLDEIICSFSEIFWSFATYIRMYSILLISLYRYLAVFHLNWYKKLNESFIRLSIPIIVTWTISIASPLISKYIFNTTHGYTLCLDGYSTSIPNTIGYCIYNYSMMIIIPSFFVFIIYIAIIRKLKKLNNKIGNENTNTMDTHSNNQTSIRHEHNHRHSITNNTAFSVHIDHINTLHLNNNSVKGIIKKDDKSNVKKDDRSIKKQACFANQFILMCLVLIACGIVQAVFSSRALIPNFFTVLYYWRPALKAYLMLAISFVPFISLYYHPDRSRLIYKIKKFFR